MRHDSVEQQKGLFTFYKEQQAEEQSRRKLKKRKKGKSKKQKKNLHTNKQAISLSSSNLKNISSTQMGEKKQPNSYSKFLRNVISKQNSQLMFSHHEKSPISIHTENHEETSHNKEQVVKFFVQRKLKGHKSSLSNIFRQGEAPKKEVEIQNNNYKLVSLHSEIQPLQIANKPQEGTTTKKEPQPVKDEKKLQNRTFLQKLKYLQQHNHGHLIANRQSIYVQNKETKDLHQQNKKYFHQLISNFYKHSDEKNQTGYKIIKDALKFPHITKADKLIRFKTEEESPLELLHKISSPLQAFSHNRKQSKRKCSNQRYSEIKPKNEQKLMNIKESRLLNFIDLSKDYSKQLVESEQRIRKKKMVRCRLGLQL